MGFISHSDLSAALRSVQLFWLNREPGGRTCKTKKQGFCGCSQCVGFIRASPLIKLPQRRAGLSDQSTSQGWDFDVEEMSPDWETPGRRGQIITG